MDAGEALKVLGLTPSATPSEIKEAHRDLAKVWHPDRFAEEPRLRAKAEETLKGINEAYQALQSGSAGRRPGTTRPSSRDSSPPTPEPGASRQSEPERGRHPPGPPEVPPRRLWTQVPLWVYAVCALAAMGPLLENRDDTTSVDAPRRVETAPPRGRTSAARPLAAAAAAPLTAQPASGAPRDVDANKDRPRVIAVGKRVRLPSERQATSAAIVWVEGMDEFRGQVGTVTRVDSDGTIQVDLDQGKYWWAAKWATPAGIEPKTSAVSIPPVQLEIQQIGKDGLSVGETVRLPTSKQASDAAIAWVNGMDAFLGQVATVTHLEADGTVRVNIDNGQYWWASRWLAPIAAK